MPDDSGNFKGAFYRAEAWMRVFGGEPTVQEAEEYTGFEDDLGPVPEAPTDEEA